MKRLKSPVFLNPIWLNNLAYKEEGIITADGMIELKGEHLKPLEPDEELREGERVTVICSNFFYYETKNEVESKEQLNKTQESSQKQKERKNIDQLCQEADNWNDQLNIPVDWTSDIKVVKSGLMENSWGDGSSKRSVYHVLLKEPIHEKRFIRHEGDFLCTTPSKDNGKFSYPVDEKGSTLIDSSGILHRKKVTCKACLEIARRWQQDSQK